MLRYAKLIDDRISPAWHLDIILFPSKICFDTISGSVSQEYFYNKEIVKIRIQAKQIVENLIQAVIW